MTYDRSHDERLVAALKAAKFTETTEGAETIVSLAHLQGYISFCDGLMSWGIFGNGNIGGSKRVNQRNIDNSAAALLNYGRKAVKSELGKIADRVIAEASHRLETA